MGISEFDVLRLGGVPEHFNAPFLLARDDNAYGNLKIEFTNYPGGTGAMGTALQENKSDVCVMLTEGAICQIANGAKQRIVGTYVESPLRWGVHKKANRAVPSNPVYGISRHSSGSHLMAFVHAEKLGLKTDSVKFEIVGSLDGAKKAMEEETIDLFLWEKFTTKHMCESGHWECIDIVPTPWPCFSFVATEEAMKTKGKALKKLIEVTNVYCRSFKKNSSNSTVTYVSKNHAMSEDDALTWLNETEWVCAAEVSEKAMLAALKYCKDLNMCPHVETKALVADDVTVRKDMPEDMYSWRVDALRNWITEQEKVLGRKATMTELSQAGHLDQYHYLALVANDELISILQLNEHDKVLDVGSGIGGPARYISWKSGCEVVGIELQEQLVNTSKEVAESVGLEKVSYRCMDACRLTEENLYSAWYSMLVILHIPKAPRQVMFARLFDSLKDDGSFLIEDYVQAAPFTEKELYDLENVVGAAYVPSVNEYRKELEAAGYVDIEFEDVTTTWTEWVDQRYNGFLKNMESHIKLQGETIAKKQELFYQAVDGLFKGGRLGGARITGRKPSAGQRRLNLGRMSSPSVSKSFSRQIMPKWMSGDHDSLQFHFFHKNHFFVLRLFGTRSLQRAWVWIAHKSDNWTPHVLFNSENVIKDEEWKHGDGEWLDISVGELSIKETAEGTELKFGPSITVKSLNREIKRWKVTGQPEEVVHRPDLVATISYNGELLQCTGYSKRYYGAHYGPRWAYHFIQGHFPVQSQDATKVTALWTADARFGDNKYNYFKVVENGKITEGRTESCYHQGYVGRCVMNDRQHTARVTPLGEQRTYLVSDKMDSEMIETICQISYDDGLSTRVGFGFYERCMGTLA